MLPPLDILGLPPDIEFRLHEALFAHGLFTKQDALRRLGDVLNAVRSALKLDVQHVLEVYIHAEDDQVVREEPPVAASKRRRTKEVTP